MGFDSELSQVFHFIYRASQKTDSLNANMITF